MQKEVKQTKSLKRGPGAKKPCFKHNPELQAKLMSARVVQKDLLYVIGLSPRIATKAVRCDNYWKHLRHL